MKKFLQRVFLTVLVSWHVLTRTVLSIQQSLRTSHNIPRISQGKAVRGVHFFWKVLVPFFAHRVWNNSPQLCKLLFYVVRLFKYRSTPHERQNHISTALWRRPLSCWREVYQRSPWIRGSNWHFRINCLQYNWITWSMHQNRTRILLASLEFDPVADFQIAQVQEKNQL